MEILTAEELLKKIRKGVKEVHEIKMRDFVIPIRMLSITEMNEIRRDAIKNVMVSKGDDVDKNLSVQRSTLQLASTLTKGGGPTLSGPLLSLMTVDEVNFLYNEYIRVCEIVNPSAENISEEHFRDLVDALKKNVITSAECSLPQLRAICTAYVDLIRRLEIQKSHKAN